MPETALSIAWHQMPYFMGGWPDLTYTKRPDAYKRLVSLPPEGRLYLAGDYISYWPGWMEGSLTSAHCACGMIQERVRQS